MATFPADSVSSKPDACKEIFFAFVLLALLLILLNHADKDAIDTLSAGDAITVWIIVFKVL